MKKTGVLGLSGVDLNLVIFGKERLELLELNQTRLYNLKLNLLLLDQILEISLLILIKITLMRKEIKLAKVTLT